MRATVLMTPSKPMMVARRWRGTHCRSMVGTVGPYSGTPTEYTADAS